MVADFSQKRNREFFNNELLFRVVGILFLVIIFVLIFTDFKIYQEKKRLALEINSYQKQIEDIKKSSQTLKDEIANSNNTDYLEKIAYEQLDEQKPGEKEIIFITPQEKPKTETQPENFWDIKLWVGWLSGVLGWIKGRF